MAIVVNKLGLLFTAFINASLLTTAESAAELDKRFGEDASVETSCPDVSLAIASRNFGLVDIACINAGELDIVDNSVGLFVIADLSPGLLIIVPTKAVLDSTFGAVENALISCPLVSLASSLAKFILFIIAFASCGVLFNAVSS